MANTLTDQHRAELRKWMSRPHAEFNLLFKATQDGCSAPAFHNKCDNKGATVTVVYNTVGYIFGGYTSQNWSSSSSYANDPNAFLFRLCYQNGQWLPVKYPIKTANQQNAIFGHAGYGPTFGGGQVHDIFFFSGTINSSGTYYQGNGGVNCNNTYDSLGHDVNVFCGNNIQYKDLEVYQVIDGLPLTPDDQPWRKSLGWNSKAQERLKSFVAKYTPPWDNIKVHQSRVLMVGPVGAGKSSFFNTINSIFRGHVINQAWSGSAGHSVTTKYRLYEVRNGRCGSPLNFRLCDTMGIEEGKGMDVADLPYLMDGNITEGYQFNPVANATPEAVGYEAKPSLSQKIHCIAIVLDACSLDIIPQKTLEKMEIVKKHAISRNIPLVLLLTKVDKVCPIVADDVTKIYHSIAVLNVMNKASEIIGIPKSQVLPVKNYESELELEMPIDILALTAMQQILRFADSYFDNYASHMAHENLMKMNISSPE